VNLAERAITGSPVRYTEEVLDDAAAMHPEPSRAHTRAGGHELPRRRPKRGSEAPSYGSAPEPRSSSKDDAKRARRRERRTRDERKQDKRRR
jgi:hypothetical protein